MKIVHLKHVIILILFVLCATNILAQKIIKGVLLSHNEEIPQGVSVVLEDANKRHNIIAYCISDDKGFFEISFSSSSDSLYLSIKSLSYKDTTLFLLNKNYNIKLKLTPQINHIKEVNVKSTPIITNEDTTTYLVSSFEKESDESIGDVISRMPGFTVDADGKIKYNGIGIDKYYIEGMDLLGNKYPIANKNLSNKQVSSVEVLHNHQPIKMLRKVIHNEKTSLNIKLKNKYTATYRLKGGIGYPWLKHSLNFSPILFTPANQMIASVQSNNIGSELYSQHHPFTLSNSYLNNYTNDRTESLQIAHIAPSFISKKSRYLNNNSNLISYNYLTKLTGDKQIKTNISLYNDNLKEKANTQTSYYLDKDTVILNELKSNKFRDNSIITDVTYTNNAANNYTNNTFRFESYLDNATGNINNTEQVSDQHTPFLSLANELDLYKLWHKHIINIKWFTDYNHAPQYLQYTPGVLSSSLNKGTFYNTCIQYFNYNNFKTLLGISFMVKKSNWQFNTNLEIKYDYNDINTYIELEEEKLQIDSLQNIIEWNNFQNKISEKITFSKNKNFKLQFTLPVIQNLYKLSSSNLAIKEPTELLSFNPEIYCYGTFLNYFEAKGKIAYSDTYTDVKNIIPGYVIKDYNTLSAGINTLGTNKIFSTKIILEFKNPVSGWIANMNYNYKTTNKNIISSKKSLGSGAFQTISVKQNNTTQSHLFNGEITYFLTTWNTSLNLNSNYTLNKYQCIIDLTIKDIKQQNLSCGLNVLFNKWRHINIKYQYNSYYTIQQTGLADYDYRGNNHSLTVYYYINKQHWLMMTYENYANSNKNSHFKSQFTDFSYSFSPVKSKFKFKLQYHNVLNTKNIAYYNTNDISLIKNQYFIRPGEIILNVTYKF